MANWNKVVKIGDLHKSYHDENITVAELGKEVAKRLKEIGIIGNVATNFLSVECVEDYDSCLEKLYDFGDHNHRLFVDTF